MPWHEGTALCLADLRWADGAPVVASPRQILRAQLERLRRARAGGLRRHRARVHRLPRHLRGGVREGLPRPQAGQPLQHRLLDARRRRGSSRCCAGSATRWARPGWRSRAPRASATTASTRSTSTTGRRCGSPTSTRSTRPARRRSPPQEKHGDHVHGQVRRSARASRATSTSRCGDDGAPLFARRRGALRALRRRPARLPARADAVLRAQRQLLQALREGLVRADGGGLGARQPHVRGARRRPRRRAAGRAAGAGRRRQPVPRAGGDDRRRAARARRTSSSSSRRSRATPTRPTSRTCRRRWPRRATCSRAATWRATRSATRSSTTTSTTPASSSRRSSPSSPTGSASRGFERL